MPPSQNRLGVEYELIPLEKESLKRLDYPRIRSLLEFLIDRTGSQPFFEESRPIGLGNKDYRITIEPGGQLEASFSPVRSVGELEEKLTAYLDLLKEAGADGIIFIAFGVDPINRLSAVPWMPKKRYELMKRYWETRPGMSLNMMKQTAAIQVSIDYNSEEDAVAKLAGAAEFSEALSSLFADSSIFEGERQTTGDFRRAIWEKTDPERSGIPLLAGKPIRSFKDYVEYALDVPMIFIYRGGRYYEPDRPLTFRRYLSDGYEGGYPDLGEWLTHLNTIFTAVRFNNSTLEIRPFDSNRPDLLLAAAALVKGLFYPPTHIPPTAIKEDECVEGIRHSSEERNEGGYASADYAPEPGELIATARKNLPEEEKGYLGPLAALVEKGITPAELADRAFGEERDFTRLVEHLKIR